MHTEENPLKGIFICLLGYFFISIIGLCEKSISHGIPIPVVLFFQNAICLVLILPSCIKHGIKSLKPGQPWSYVIRIGSGLGCYATLFYIIRFIPISEALLYQYSGALWIPLLMLAWLEVRMDPKLWAGIIVGFIGIVFILKPSQSMLSLISLLGLLCSLFQGISMVAIRKLSMTEPMYRVLFYYFLVNITFTAPGLLTPSWSMNLMDLLFLTGVGVSTYLALKLVTMAMQYAHPSTLAPVCYTSILYSGFFGWVFWGEVPKMLTLLGMLFVIAGCILTLLMSRPGIPSAALETAD